MKIAHPAKVATWSAWPLVRRPIDLKTEIVVAPPIWIAIQERKSRKTDVAPFSVRLAFPDSLVLP
jgi:hypothetical protein